MVSPDFAAVSCLRPVYTKSSTRSGLHPTPVEAAKAGAGVTNGIQPMTAGKGVIREAESAGYLICCRHIYSCNSAVYDATRAMIETRRPRLPRHDKNGLETLADP